MDALTATVWWIALILALIITLVLLAVIIRVVFILREIDRLARRTLPAAAGIAQNTATIAALDDVAAQAGRLLGGVHEIESAAASIRQRVARIGAALTAGRSH